MDQSQWHSLRQQNVGGSEVAALFGESPYMSRFKLWQIKKGNMQPDNLDGVEHVMAGNFFESGILEWAKYKFATAFLQPRLYVKHAHMPGMGCTPDGFPAEQELYIDGRPTRIAQVKLVGESIFTPASGWETDFKGSDRIVDAPLHIGLQCQHEMACTGARENHLLVGVLGYGRKLCRLIVERDDVVIAAIERQVGMFWESIEANDPPSPDYAEDRQAILASLPARIRIETMDMTHDNALRDAMVNYTGAAAASKLAEERKEEAGNRILDIAGHIKKFTCGDLKASIVTVAPSPGKMVTPEMVGTMIGERKGSTYPRITPNAA